MTVEKEADNEDYLDKSARKLLKEFGEGNHIPGSGSANALSTLLAIGLMKTVCKITLDKPKYENIHKYLRPFLLELEEKFEPQFEELFQKDIEVFNKVLENRKRRDEAKTDFEKEECNSKGLEKLKIATEIQIQICEICLELFESASAIFDRCYKTVRGDSGVAISNLLSASFGSLFVIFLNLKSFPEDEWLKATQIKAETLAKQLVSSQVAGFEKILDLHEELKKPNRHFRVEVFSDE